MDHAAMGPGGVFVMWAVMMVGMMLPSATPAAVLYGTLVRKNAERGNVLPSAWLFAAGYLAVWMLFSALAAILQTALAHASMLTPMMATASRPLTGTLLLVAGLYQLSPLKNLCLGKCREPLQFFMTRWHPGTWGAVRMGLSHGAYCVGCCWALMLLLFAVGVMSLGWVVLLAALVFIEKLLPAGRLTARFAGVALIVAGLAVLARG